MTAKTIRSAALKLPAEDRSRLASELLLSLEGQDAEAMERAWIEEADRRYRRYRSGEDTGMPAKQAIAAAREKLR
jgi:Putative addiction module component